MMKSCTVWLGVILGLGFGASVCFGAGLAADTPTTPAQAPAPGAAQADAPRAADAEGRAAAPVRLTFAPTQASINRSVNFDEHGEPRHRNSNLSVSFRCQYETDDQPLSYSELKLTSALTSAGEKLDVNSEQHRQRHQQNIQVNRHHQGKPFFSLYFNLPAPERVAESITEIRGELTMELSAGPERAIRLGPISKFIDKRFRVADMEDLPMGLRRVEAHNNHPELIEFRYPRSAQPLIRDVSFFQPNGTKLELRNHGGGGSNDQMYQRFAMPADDKSVMVVRLFRQTRQVVVPFVVRDVPLPFAEPRGPEFDLAVVTEPIEDLAIADPAAGLPAEDENVRVIILE